MDQTQPSHEPDACVPEHVEEGFMRRQRLRAIVASYRDLYDPPNTAAAFSLLEAALDEAKRNEDDGERQMLDAPTTAERFFKIEAAIDEVLARSATTTTWRPKRTNSEPRLSTHAAISDSEERAHLLRKRQQWLTGQNIPTGPRCSTETQWAERKSTGLILEPQVHFFRDVTIPPRSSSIDWNRIASEFRINTHSAVEMPVPRINTPPEDLYHDVDIFRDHEAMEAFINETYEAAREKHLGGG